MGKVRWEFDELASTNDYARVLSNEPNTLEGTAILAGRQTAGRGQMGAVWESAPGQNLTLSVILFPKWLRADQQAALGKAVALAVFDTLSSVTMRSDIFIKWPNDLIINYKKVSGVLIENTISGSNLSSAIVGIGINANQMQFSTALVQASSIQQITGQTVDLSFLADVLLESLEYWYEQLRNGQYVLIQNAYLSKLLGLNQVCSFALPSGTIIEGLIRDVGTDGRLCVESAGNTQLFGVKEVRQIY